MGDKILVLLGPLTLFWYGVDNLRKLGHEVVTYDMIENGSGLEAIIGVVEAENPTLVAIDGSFPLRTAAIGRALTERGVKCLPILLGSDLEKRRRKRDGEIRFINRPIVDMLIEVFGCNSSGDLEAFDKRGEIADLEWVLNHCCGTSARE